MTDVASPHATDVPTTDETEALVERLFAATIESLEIASVHLDHEFWRFYRLVP